MDITIHLTFSGRCEEAFKFYERVMGGEIVTMLRYGSSPTADQVPLEWQDKIVHATLIVGGRSLSGVDVLPEQYERPQGFYALLDVDELGDGERMFASLSEKGVVRMPFQQTFWSPGFGVVVDQFGVPWEVSCGQKAPGERTGAA